MAGAIELPFGFRLRVGQWTMYYMGSRSRHGKGQFWGGNRRTTVNYRDTLQSSVQTWLNRSICRLSRGLERAEGCTSSIEFARWRQCALMGGHIATTWRIRLNHTSTAAMRLTSNYFDHLSFLDTPTSTVAERFELNTVLWAFHTIQPSSSRVGWIPNRTSE